MKDDNISRAAVLNCVYGSSPNKIKGRIAELPPAQPSVSKTEIVGDAISRQALLDAVDGVPWYHQNKNGEMVHGASDKEQAWYKAEDIYKAIENVPSAQPEITNEEIRFSIKQLRVYLAMKIRDGKDGGVPVELLKCVEEIQKYFENVPSAQPDMAENLYLYKCYITDKNGLQHEVIHTGDIRRVTGWEI